MHLFKKFRFLLLLALGVAMILPGKAGAKEAVQTWEVLDPSGIVEMKSFPNAPRLSTLEGKTIVLRWNDKHNGDNFLNRIAELLAEKVPSAKVIKLYEVDKSTIRISGSVQEAARIAKVIKGLNADIVIAAYTD